MSVATYSCDPGYALVGQTTRTCEDTNGGTVTTGTWSGNQPFCQGIILSLSFCLRSTNTPILHTEILCQGLSSPSNGNIVLSNETFGVGTTATYSCDPGYVLTGEVTRTCEDRNRGTTGTWSGSMPVCEGIQTQTLVLKIIN